VPDLTPGAPPELGPVALKSERLVEALRTRERFLDAVLDSLETFFAVDAHWRVTFANRAAAAMIGATAVGIIGRDVRELMGAGLRGESAEHLLRAMEQRVSVDYVATAPGGRVSHGTVYPLDDGGLAVYVRDVSEQARTEEALRESERRLQVATRAAALGVYEYDARTGALHGDARTRAIWGVGPQEPLELDTFLSGLHPDDSERVRMALESAVDPAADGRFRQTYRVLSRDGELRWVVSTGIVVHEDGGARRLVGTVEDITERRRLEEAVRESEERLNLALSVGGIATWDYHIDTGDVIWNDQHFTMLGYRLREVAPGYESLLARVHPDDAAAVDRAFRTSLEKTTDYRVEFRVLRPGGDVRYVSAVGHLELDPAGGPLRQYGVMLDLTERRRDEQALLDAEAEKASHEERGRLARDLHDSVTQALFAVSLKAEALTTGEALPAALAADVEEVSRLSRGALAQMRSMLLELRGDPLDQVPLEHLLRNAVEATESRTHTDVDLVIEGSGTLPAPLHVALYRITQEALNNVARHAQAPSAEVRLELSGSHVRLTIRDDGCGFDPVPRGLSHLGLRSMRERATEAGARFTLVTEPGGGTLVRVVWDAGEAREHA
jgi:PAS domain S-box-containing protein